MDGKGFSNKTSVTLIASTLRLPCLDSYIKVYDGIPGRDNAKLIGRICGHDANVTKPLQAKSGILTVQYQQYHGFNISGHFHVFFRLNQCNVSCSGNHHCVQENGQSDAVARCMCKPGWMGANCSERRCPGNCSYATNKGFCNEVRELMFNFLRFA